MLLFFNARIPWIFNQNNFMLLSSVVIQLVSRWNKKLFKTWKIIQGSTVGICESSGFKSSYLEFMESYREFAVSPNGKGLLFRNWQSLPILIISWTQRVCWYCIRILVYWSNDFHWTPNSSASTELTVDICMDKINKLGKLSATSGKLYDMRALRSTYEQNIIKVNYLLFYVCKFS